MVTEQNATMSTAVAQWRALIDSSSLRSPVCRNVDFIQTEVSGWYGGVVSYLVEIVVVVPSGFIPHQIKVQIPKRYGETLNPDWEDIISPAQSWNSALLLSVWTEDGGTCFNVCHVCSVPFMPPCYVILDFSFIAAAWYITWSRSPAGLLVYSLLSGLTNSIWPSRRFQPACLHST